ncbi:MAG: hypothetical protein ACYDA4_03880 [Ignavibacteriaceae bacterium]
MKNNYESRLKKIEEILLPKRNTVLIINYITSEPESYLKVNGTKCLIPPGVDAKEFIKEKLKAYGGVVTAIVYLAQDITKESVPNFSDLAKKKDDLLITIKGYDGKI